MYHIVPSPDHHCPIESCLTLSSFATNVSQYIESNTLLLFQPGNHVMRSKINITGIVNFSMISISPLRAGLTCENNSEPRVMFIFNTVQHVHVRNLRLFECKYVFGDKILFTLMASSLELVNCIFENNIRTSMINARNCNITIAQCTFKDNVLSFKMINWFIYCNVTIDNSTFINNECTGVQNPHRYMHAYYSMAHSVHVQYQQSGVRSIELHTLHLNRVLVY